MLFQEGKVFANENSLLFMETSAKAAVNVAEIFTAIGSTSCITYLTLSVTGTCVHTFKLSSSMSGRLTCPIVDGNPLLPGAAITSCVT